ncbi:MAG: outer membrane beta-barrel protein [Gemmatimonadetes bacterium]|nr:outer membrane beta-barrel protein [Gemmatimonadota bacterium]
MNMRSWVASLATLLAAAPATLHAQNAARSWSVNLRGGSVLYADASALETGATAGLEALYYLTPRIAIGPSADYVYSKSDGRFFVAALDFGPDSSRVYNVGQRLNVLHYGGSLLVDLLPGNQVGPYLTGGAGGYSIYLEGNANDGFGRVSGLMFAAGGGIRLALTGNAGLQLDARDLIYTDLDREELNPIRPEHRNCQPERGCRFPGAEDPGLPAPETTVHNIRVTLGFSYVPGQTR